MCHVEQLGAGEQVVVTEIVRLAPAVVHLEGASELDRVPVAAFGEVTPDSGLQVADAEFVSW